MATKDATQYESSGINETVEKKTLMHEVSIYCRKKSYNNSYT